jgi:hypothetical protein
MQKKTLEAVKNEVKHYENMLFLNPVHRTPGRLAEIRAWKSIQRILEQFQLEKKDK